MPSIEYKGSCVCGQTTYTAFDLNDISYCHCEQCRKMTGHFMAASQVSREKIEIQGKIKWFYTHEGSRHGFCDNCGANMFWQNDNKPTISVTAGVFLIPKNWAPGTIYLLKKKDVIIISTLTSLKVKAMVTAK